MNYPLEDKQNGELSNAYDYLLWDDRYYQDASPEVIADIMADFAKEAAIKILTRICPSEHHRNLEIINDMIKA